MTAKPLNPDERAKLLEFEAELQRRTLRASIDTLYAAKGVTWALAGASLVTKLTGVHKLRKAKWAGYALLAGRALLKARRVRRDRKRLPR